MNERCAGVASTFLNNIFNHPRKRSSTHKRERGENGPKKRRAHKLSVPIVTYRTCVINALKMLLNLVVSTVGTIISK